MKGITVLVAVILMLLITIGMTGIGFVFITSSTDAAKEAVERQQAQEPGGVPRIDRVYNYTVYVYSAGRTELKNPTFYVDGQQINAQGPAALAPGSVGTYLLDQGQLTGFPDPAEVKVTAGNSVDFLTAFLKALVPRIIPMGSVIPMGDVVVAQANIILFQQNNGSDIASITEAGNMGVGTVTPNAKLHVVGAICAEPTDTNCLPAAGDIMGTRLCIGTDCRNVWPAGGGGGAAGWTTTLTTVYNNTPGVNTGIGTSTPNAKLNVVEETGAVVPLQLGGYGNGVPLIDLRKARGTMAAPTNVINGDSLGIIDTYGYFSGAMRSGARINSYVDGAPSGTLVPNSLSFYVNGSNRIVINGTKGYVGIGTSSPQLPFVLKARSAGGAMAYIIDDVDGTALSIQSNGFNAQLSPGGSSGTLFLNPNGGSTVISPSSGNVGVGTPLPDTKLHVVGAICAEASDTNCAPTSGDVRGTRLCIGTDCRNVWPAGGSSQWTTSGSDIYYSTGNVGIGTTVPQTKLEVTNNGAAQMILINNTNPASAGQEQYLSFANTGGQFARIAGFSGGATSGFITIYTKSSGTLAERVRIDNLGNVGIGTNNPTAKLHVVGGTTSLQQEAWQVPTLINGWVNFGFGFQTARYFKDSLGIVHVSGLISGGTADTTVATLPVGYRPPAHIQFPVLAQSGTGSSDMGWRVMSNGDLLCLGCGTGWISLDGIEFMTT